METTVVYWGIYSGYMGIMKENGDYCSIIGYALGFRVRGHVLSMHKRKEHHEQGIYAAWAKEVGHGVPHVHEHSTSDS